MSEEGLHIDTHGASTAAEHEHQSEDNQNSAATTATDSESTSEETDESPIFDVSEKPTHDLSPTTPIHPEHHEDILEKTVEDPVILKLAEPETDAEMPSPDSTIPAEMDTNIENPDEELAQETSIPAHTEAADSGEEPAQDPPTERTEEDEAQHQPLSTPVETEDHIGAVPPHQPTSITAESESAKERDVEETQQETPEDSNPEFQEGSKEIGSDSPLPDKIEPDVALEEETQEHPEAGEKDLGVSADKELPETPLPVSAEPDTPPEAAPHEPQAPTELEEPTTNQTPEATKELPKPTPSDRESRALDVVKRSRYQFRVALDVFLRLINEAEDDDGIIHLNLVERDSDLRKTVGMLGLKMQSLADAERDLDWAQLLDKHEAKKQQE